MTTVLRLAEPAEPIVSDAGLISVAVAVIVVFIVARFFWRR